MSVGGVCIHHLLEAGDIFDVMMILKLNIFEPRKKLSMVDAIDGNCVTLCPSPLLIVHFWERNFRYKCQQHANPRCRDFTFKYKLSSLIFILNIWVQRNRATQVRQDRWPFSPTVTFSQSSVAPSVV